MTDLWTDHVRLYSQREATRLLTSEQRHADWEHACGWCCQPFAAHFEPVSHHDADELLGRLPHLSSLTISAVDVLRIARVAEMAMTVVAALSPDSLPDHEEVTA